MMSLSTASNARVDGLFGLVARLANAVERYAPWGVALYGALYTVAILRFSALRPLWTDELGTYYVSRLSSAGRIIQALKNNADMQPPLFPFLSHPLAMTGSAMLLRLPAVLGVLCMSVGLYFFVSRRLTRVHGLLAMLLPLVTGVRSYCYEARPYGLVLGAATLALVCWQLANDGKHRLPALIGLWFFSTFTVSIHYFGIFVLLPFLLGEAVKWWVNRRPDWPVIAVLCSAVLPDVVALPIIQSVRALGIRFLYEVKFPGSVVDTYNYLLEPAVVPGVELLLIVLIWLIWARPQSALAEGAPGDRNNVAEIAVICGFIVLPIAGMVVGRLLDAFMPRYVLAGTIGFCAGLPYLVRRHRELATVCLLAIAFNTGMFLFMRLIHAPPGPKTVPAAAMAPDTLDLPVVFVGAHEYVETHFYAASAVAPRLAYLGNRALARHWTGTDHIDAFLFAWAPISDCRIQDYFTFIATHKRFLVVSRQMDAFPWLLQQLKVDKASMTLRDTDGSQLVYDVTMPN